MPALIAAGLGLGARVGTNLARRHRVVNLAERVYLEDSGRVQDTTDASAAFRATSASVDELYASAQVLRHRYVLAGRLGGGWVGLVVGLKLITLAIRRRRRDYEADQTRCIACARCYLYCPQELKRLGWPVPEASPGAPRHDPAAVAGHAASYPPHPDVRAPS